MKNFNINENIKNELELVEFDNNFIEQPLDEQTKAEIENRIEMEIGKPTIIIVDLNKGLARWGDHICVLLTPEKIINTTTYKDAWSWKNPERSEDAAYAVKYFFRDDDPNTKIKIIM